MLNIGFFSSSKDDESHPLRAFMEDNKLSQYAESVIEAEWLLDDLVELSPDELQKIADELNMRKGAANRFIKAITKRTSGTFFAWLLCFILGIKLTNAISSLSDKGALFV